MKEHDIVILKHDDPEAGVKTTNIGVIVCVHAPGCFTVEFIDDDNNTIEASLLKVYSEKNLILV